ncbi:unnamed protein product, partial [Symbiodinium sp. KB8]
MAPVLEQEALDSTSSDSHVNTGGLHPPAAADPVPMATSEGTTQVDVTSLAGATDEGASPQSESRGESKQREAVALNTPTVPREKKEGNGEIRVTPRQTLDKWRRLLDVAYSELSDFQRGNSPDKPSPIMLLENFLSASATREAFLRFLQKDFASLLPTAECVFLLQDLQLRWTKGMGDSAAKHRQAALKAEDGTVVPSPYESIEVEDSDATNSEEE